MAEELRAVDPDAGGFLDDRPRCLLALVPLVRGGTDDGLGELVQPLLHLNLLVVEFERERGSGGNFGRHA